MNAFIKNALNAMDDEQRTHFSGLAASLLACYTDGDIVGIVLLGVQDSTGAVAVTDMISLNGNDIAMSQMLNEAAQEMSLVVMADAPPREQYS